MVDSLLARNLLEGKTCNEARDILGLPPKTDYVSTYDLVYWLGPERGCVGIDSKWLVLKCSSPSGIVTEAKLVRD